MVTHRACGLKSALRAEVHDACQHGHPLDAAIHSGADLGREIWQVPAVTVLWYIRQRVLQ